MTSSNTEVLKSPKTCLTSVQDKNGTIKTPHCSVCQDIGNEN